jgi:uncharacterized RmlC-like cupin family protein
MKGIAALTVASLALTVIAPLARAQPDPNVFLTVSPEDVKWRNVPTVRGLQTAVIAGDPTKPGVYVLRVKYAPGVMTRPHFNPEDRYAVVLQGTWWIGTGSEFEPAKAVAVKAGTFMKLPARQPHYEGAKDGETIVQIVGVGPSATLLVRPEQGLTGPSR